MGHVDPHTSLEDNELIVFEDTAIPAPPGTPAPPRPPHRPREVPEQKQKPQGGDPPALPADGLASPSQP